VTFAPVALPASSINLDDPNSVSPGILGFLAFFLLAVALYLLVRNMNGHLRRVRYRQEALEAEQADEAAKAATAAKGVNATEAGPDEAGEHQQADGTPPVP
jgi:hypothetical protein